MATLLFERLVDFLKKHRSVGGYATYRWRVSSKGDDFAAYDATGNIYGGILSLPENILRKECDALMEQPHPNWPQDGSEGFMERVAHTLWYQVEAKYFAKEMRPQRPHAAPERLTYWSRR